MAVRFNATGEHYDGTGGVPTGTVATVTCWIYSAGRADFGGIWDIGTTDPPYLLTPTLDSDGTSLYAWDSDFSTLGPHTITASTWYRLAVTVSGSSWTMRVGTAAGSLTAYTANTFSGFVGTDRIRIGANIYGEWFDGRVAAFKVWAAALTLSEIEAELAQYEPVRTTNLLRYHPFVVAETTDHSSGGHTLTGGTGTTTEAGPPIPDPDPDPDPDPGLPPGRFLLAYS